MEWPVLNIESIIVLIKMINNLLNLSKGLNLNNVLNVNIGSREMMDVLLWVVNVVNSFVMIVEEHHVHMDLVLIQEELVLLILLVDLILYKIFFVEEEEDDSYISFIILHKYQKFQYNFNWFSILRNSFFYFIPEPIFIIKGSDSNYFAVAL